NDAGVSYDIDNMIESASEHRLFIVEDADQALLSTYKGEPLGTIVHFGTFNFHDTKNYTCGEGGALLVNHKPSIERAEIIQEKGTNRSQFVRGMVDKYTWRDLGSSFLLSELNAACRYAQLENANQIHENRMQTWKNYYQKLYPLMEAGYIKLPTIPEECMHN